MQVPVFRAKDKDSDQIIEGFYFVYPVVNKSASVPNSNEISASNIAQCLITYKPGVIAAINEPIGCSIDITTLEFVKFVEVPCRFDPIIVR